MVVSRFVISAKESSDDKPLKDTSLNKVDQNTADKPLKLFSMYRRGDISEDHDENQRTDSDKPQFDGAVTRDGKCVIFWNSAAKSIAIFDSLDEMLLIHGHDESRYGSQLVWHDVVENN
jgi:hypothetical protein